MSAVNGYNPMRYSCENQGCFNTKCRPKIEVFADCFPGRINFGDVDAEVEINGYSLRIEWKSHTGNIPTGQRIMFTRKTQFGIDTVICVCGNAETMEVHSIGAFAGGEWRDWRPSSLDDLKFRIANWVKWAEKQPPMTTIAGIMRCITRKFSRQDIMNFIASDVARMEQHIKEVESQRKKAA